MLMSHLPRASWAGVAPGQFPLVILDDVGLALPGLRGWRLAISPVVPRSRLVLGPLFGRVYRRMADSV